MRPQPSVADVDVLVRLLEGASDPRIKGLIFEDLFWSSRNLDRRKRESIYTQAGLSMLPSYIKNDLRMPIGGNLNLKSTHKPKTIDVAVVTVKPAELDAAKLTFDIDFEQEPNRRRRGAKFWELSLQTEPQRRPLNVVVTMSGEAGNYEMASFCQTLFREYSIGLCVLIGMAAGRRNHVKLGDVVCATEVLDYVHSVQRPTGPQVDPRSFKLDRRVSRQLSYFNPVRQGWHELLRERLDRAEQLADGGLAPLPSIDLESFEPNFSSGVILAGDYLLEDDSLDQRAESLSRRKARAAEMEGAGFAAACEEADIPWIVIRGIADFGRPRRSKDWQLLATLAAGTALRVLLTKEYDLSDVEDEKPF